jgi:hypothetical protein
MEPGTLSTFLKRGAIWGFIVLELIFFSIAGEYLSLSDKAFMDLDNMLLLFKQSAPDRHHRHRHDHHNDQRQHRPQRRCHLCPERRWSCSTA